MDNKLFIGGVYTHYNRGGKYVVIGIAHHSETLEELVIYRALYDDGDIWARPKKMFLENVEKSGKTVPRFKLVKKP
ncbi:MAG: DUF1653 domain-containing protein [Candidatus Nanosyncoccaceae bacterium]|jgi:hypothetical protein